MRAGAHLRARPQLTAEPPGAGKDTEMLTPQSLPTLPTGRFRRRLLVAMAVVVSLLGVACSNGKTTATGTTGIAAGSGTTAVPVTLRIAYVPATTALPLQVAKMQGFFAQQNLNVTLTQAANISNIPATLGKQFDLSMGTATDLIQARAGGLDVVQVAGETIDTAANPFVQLMVRPNSGITGITGLKGKRVGSPTLSGVIHVAVLYWAKQKGVDPSTIMGVEAPSPNLPNLLTAGQVDAVEALEPFATTLRQAGNVSLGDPFASIAEPLATNFWVAQGAWARAHLGVIARFVAAMKQAQAFIGQNPTAARSVLQQYTGMTATVATSVTLPTYDFTIRTNDLATWIKVLKSVGQLSATVDLNKLVLAPAVS
jgi:NitT/TauT family transport system substrate-binding protein